MLFTNSLRVFRTAIVLIGFVLLTDAYPYTPYLARRIPEFHRIRDQSFILMDGNRRSFSDALQEMDTSIQKEFNKNSFDGFNPQKPNFKVFGRRISEMKCLDYIWTTKSEEAELKASQRKINEDSLSPGQRWQLNPTGIIGGVSTVRGEFGHMGALGWKGAVAGKWEFQCGGSLISKNFVLTAAHCKTTKTPHIVRFGVVNITDDENATDRRVVDFTKHPNYIPNYRNFDIAVIKLAKKVTFNEYIRPACIMNQRNLKEAIITGWGGISNQKGIISNDLLQANVDVLPNEQCKRNWWAKYQIMKWNWKSYFEDDQICAIKINGVGDVCGGDSGGPLQSKLKINTQKSLHNIFGVTSFNYECGSPVFTSVYTNVNTYVDWIENIVWGEEKRSLEYLLNSNQVTDQEIAEEYIKVDENLEVKQTGNGYWFLQKTPKGTVENFLSEYELALYNQKK